MKKENSKLLRDSNRLANRLTFVSTYLQPAEQFVPFESKLLQNLKLRSFCSRRNFPNFVFVSRAYPTSALGLRVLPVRVYPGATEVLRTRPAGNLGIN